MIVSYIYQEIFYPANPCIPLIDDINNFAKTHKHNLSIK